jgi:hypothetical protein
MMRDAAQVVYGRDLTELMFVAMVRRPGLSAIVAILDATVAEG